VASLDRETTALLVVDVQNDYVDPDGALGKAGVDMAANVAMIPRLEDLLAAAREHHIFVVFTRNWHRPATDSQAWRERVERSMPLDERPGRADTWGADFYRVSPREGEEVVSKFRYDAFLGTNLEYLLRARSISTVIVGGVTTNVCVESTARSAHMRDFHVLLVEDCCSSDDQSLHEATLTNIRRYFGDVVRAADIEDAWARGAHA
jgi:nicotinamidase-related amidase